jgi:hypothetical protein
MSVDGGWEKELEDDEDGDSVRGPLVLGLLVELAHNPQSTQVTRNWRRSWRLRWAFLQHHFNPCPLAPGRFCGGVSFINDFSFCRCRR